MADFSISGVGVNNSIVELEDMKIEIAKIEQEIQGIINGLYESSSSIVAIKRALNKELSNVTNERQKFAVLSSTLSEIMRLYERTENKIVETTGVSEKVKEAIQEAYQHVRNTGEQYGMDYSCAYGGDPVNLSNGNFIYDKSCLKLNSDKQLELKLFYNAQSHKTGIFGKGWSHSFSCNLEKTEAGIIIHLDDASTLNFILVEGKYNALPGIMAYLVVETDYYMVTTKDQDVYVFDLNGRLIEKKDIYGKGIVFNYNETGQLCSVVDGSESIFFTYNERDKVVKASDSYGRKVDFNYDNDLLCSIGGLNNRNVYFEYNKKQLLENVIDSERQIILCNIYDIDGRAIEQRFADGGFIKYDYGMQEGVSCVTVTEQNGNKIKYLHDDLRRNTNIVYENGEESFVFNDQNLRTSFTDKRGHVSEYEYDNAGNVVRFKNACGHIMNLTYTDKNQVESVRMDNELIHKAYYDKNGLQVSLQNGIGGTEYFEYNENHLPIKWIKADGTEIHMEYDEHGNLISISNSMGGVSKYVYDNRNRTIKSIDAYGNESCYEYNEADELTMVKDAYGNQRSYEYDKHGNVISMTNELGAKTFVRYNNMNRPVEITDVCGNRIKYEYNLMSDVVKQIAADGGITSYEYDQFRNLTKIIDANGNCNQMEYDPCGNMIARTDANGNVHRIEYDELNRPITVITPVGMKVCSTYDVLGNVTGVFYEDGTSEEATYDLAGNLLSYKDQNGYVKRMTYDVSGNLIEVSDDLGVISTYEYYLGGLLRKESNINGTSTEFFYDLNENVIKAINSDGCTWGFEYDCLERIVEVTKNDISIEKYEYDAVGNIIAVIDAGNNKTEYQYNPAGKVIKVKDARGFETGYQYDSCNRLTTILQSDDGHIEPEILMNFNTCQKKIRITSFMYDKVGNAVKIINPNGGQVEYTYDGCGNIISKKDEDGNYVSCEYAADGKEKLIQFSNGKTIKYEYDALRRLSQLEDWLGITKIKSDAAGRVVSVTTPNNENIQYDWLSDGRKSAVIYPNGEKIDYVYDEKRRLESITNGTFSSRYKYFDNGKLKEKWLPNNTCVEYKYGDNGKISELSHKHNQIILNKFIYEYDVSDRKVVKSHNRIDREDYYQYEYNSMGNLSKVFLDGKCIEQYEYDNFGNRIWEKINEIETKYTYGVDDQLLSKKTEDKLIEYTYDMRGNLRTETENGQMLYSYKYDELNLLTDIISSKEKLKYTYNGFGQRVAENYEGEIGSNLNRIYVCDITRESDNILAYAGKDGLFSNVWWDDSYSVISSSTGIQSILHDELMSPYAVINSDGVKMSCSYSTYGKQKCMTGESDIPFAFTGYQQDRLQNERLFANRRDYNTNLGRFLSKDPVAGNLAIPMTLNPFIYCLCDPVNFYDPTGMVIAWLAGGIVGAVANVAVKAGGDVVKSIKNGKPTFSSWQSYVGTATGGFVQGSVLIATGSASLAGAAGGATEALVTGGLSMATGAEGYRKEDGYTWKNLLGDTAKATASGAMSGFVFGNAAKYIKIPGINKGIGSYQAVWKQVVTKASKGMIKNISWKTIGKGIVAYGGVKFLDTIVKKGYDEGKAYIKEKGIEIGKSILERIKEKHQTITTPAKVLSKDITPTCQTVG